MWWCVTKLNINATVNYFHQLPPLLAHSFMVITTLWVNIQFCPIEQQYTVLQLLRFLMRRLITCPCRATLFTAQSCIALCLKIGYNYLCKGHAWVYFNLFLNCHIYWKIIISTVLICFNTHSSLYMVNNGWWMRPFKSGFDLGFSWMDTDININNINQLVFLRNPQPKNTFSFQHENFSRIVFMTYDMIFLMSQKIKLVMSLNLTFGFFKSIKNRIFECFKQIYKEQLKSENVYLFVVSRCPVLENWLDWAGKCRLSVDNVQQVAK